VVRRQWRGASLRSAHDDVLHIVAQVYEGTSFLAAHPGGGESITLVAGEDASEDFMAIHSSDAKRQLVQFHIGTFETSPSAATSAPVDAEAVDGPDSPFLVKNRWKPAVLESIENVSHDSRIYRFALGHPDQPLGLPIGAHAYTRLKRKVLRPKAGGAEGETELVEGDQWVQRAYTPVSLPDARGFIDLLIKYAPPPSRWLASWCPRSHRIYHPVDSFEGGKMTMGFNELVIGDKVEFKGPIGHFVWQAPGLALWKNVERRVRKVGMICGGSGARSPALVIHAAG
jgi:nitrate reductase (NAD(P)H)